MAQAHEWRLDLYRDPAGEVYASLFEFADDGQGSIVADERFGPFDTGLEVSLWLARHWAPRAGLPLR